jgi:3-phosphoshikimate 1-carboxyvinyltransferase
MRISKKAPISFKGEFSPPGDKSISHRAVFLGAISESKIKVDNFLFCQDCYSTINAFKNLGVDIVDKEEEDSLLISGVGLKGLKKPASPLFLGNSGTTMRILLGILSAQEFETVLTGDESLSKRPMKRVTYPLRLMGADIEGKDDANFAPLKIRGANLNAIEYRLPVASAQVKSAILLAGLYANGKTTIIESKKSRDHTERMLSSFSANIKVEGLKIEVKPTERILVKDFTIPGDISSASFFIALTILAKNSFLKIKNVGLNPTRLGFINVLKRMGARIEIVEKIKDKESPIHEPVGEIVVFSSKLKATEVKEDEIPLLIDEIPILILISCFAEGETVIREVQELRVKETDRVNSMYQNLKNMGADINISKNDIFIKRVKHLKGTKLSSFSDHRTAMTSIIAALIAKGDSEIDDVSCIDVSFPKFIDKLEELLDEKLNYLT